MTASTKMAVLWVVASCSLVEVYLLPSASGRRPDVLMMEAASTSETSVNFYQTTWRNNPEDSHLLIPIYFDRLEPPLYNIRK
jgi:hypothetical protein